MIIIIGLLFLKKQETDSGNFSSSLTKYYQFCTTVGIPSERKAKEAMCLFCFLFSVFCFCFCFFFSLHEDLLKDIRNYTEYHRYWRVGSKNLGLTANFGRFLASNMKSFETSLCAVDLSYGSLIMIKLNNLICVDDYF